MKVNDTNNSTVSKLIIAFHVCFHNVFDDLMAYYFVRPKNIMCFGQPDPTYRNRPTLDFFYENNVFFVGVFIIEVSI